MQLILGGRVTYSIKYNNKKLKQSETKFIMKFKRLEARLGGQAGGWGGGEGEGGGKGREKERLRVVLVMMKNEIHT